MSDTSNDREGEVGATPLDETRLREIVWGLARYCNGLTPYKLNDPKDPIVEGAINDWVANLLTLIKDSNRLAVIEELEELLLIDFEDDLGGKYPAMTLDDYLENRIATLNKMEGSEE